MDPKCLGEIYDLMADDWQDDRFDQRNGINQHRKALEFLECEGISLNVGCGCNTRFNPLLREKGLKIEGLDVSSKMVQLARQCEPDALYYEADICNWTPAHSYMFITAWDSVWHVPLSQQVGVMSKLLGALAPGGVCIFSAGGLSAEREHYDSTMGPEVYYSTLGIPRLMSLIDECDCVCRHLEFDQWPEVHLSVIAQRAT